MNPYVAVAKARFVLLLQYRAAALAGVCTQLFWGLLRVMIFTALYTQVEAASMPMTLQQTVTYVWLVQAFLAMIPWNIEKEIEQLVRNGGVAYELVRPVNLYGLWYARALAWRSAPLLLRVFPVCFVAWLFFGFQLPPNLVSAGLFVVSMSAALLLGTAITVLMMISLFWTVTSNGIVKVMVAGVMIFSGMEVPLPLFPQWAQPFLYALPFRGVVDTPFRLYTGHIPPDQALLPILHQLLWTAALVFAGQWLISRAQRALVVQGG